MGIQIMSVLANVHSQLIASSGVVLQPHVRLDQELPFLDPHEDPVQYIKEIFIQWCEGRSDRLPTWVQFLDVLRSIGLTELSQKIEAFLKGTHLYYMSSILKLVCTCLIYFSYMIPYPQYMRRGFHFYKFNAVNSPLMDAPNSAHMGLCTDWKFNKNNVHFFQLAI